VRFFLGAYGRYRRAPSLLLVPTEATEDVVKAGNCGHGTGDPEERTQVSHRRSFPPKAQ